MHRRSRLPGRAQTRGRNTLLHNLDGARSPDVKFSKHRRVVAAMLLLLRTIEEHADPCHQDSMPSDSSEETLLLQPSGLPIEVWKRATFPIPTPYRRGRRLGLSPRRRKWGQSRNVPPFLQQQDLLRHLFHLPLHSSSTSSATRTSRCTTGAGPSGVPEPTFRALRPATTEVHHVGAPEPRFRRLGVNNGPFMLRRSRSLSGPLLRLLAPRECHQPKGEPPQIIRRLICRSQATSAHELFRRALQQSGTDDRNSPHFELRVA